MAPKYKGIQMEKHDLTVVKEYPLSECPNPSPRMQEEHNKIQTLIERYGLSDVHRTKARAAITTALDSDDVSEKLSGAALLLKYESQSLAEDSEMWKRRQIEDGKPTEIVLTGELFKTEIDNVRARLRKAIDGVDRTVDDGANVATDD